MDYHFYVLGTKKRKVVEASKQGPPVFLLMDTPSNNQIKRLFNTIMKEIGS
jgi:hypothetical protein